jgi:hypothetical protein
VAAVPMRRWVPTGYPPFTLADVADYPARLDLEYPLQLNRWQPLVKWLLAFPQYILVGALVGSSYAVATSVRDGRAIAAITTHLHGMRCPMPKIKIVLSVLKVMAGMTNRPT